MPHTPGHIVQPPTGGGGSPNQPAKRLISKMGGEDIIKTIIDEIINIPNMVLDSAKELFTGAVNAFSDAFRKDGIFSADNITQALVIYQLAEHFGQNDQKESLATQRKEFEAFLPQYVSGMITAGQMEQTALDDLDYLLDYGIKIERDASGVIIGRKKSGDGRIDIENEQLYGIRNEYAVDDQGNIVFEKNASGDLIPKVLRTGRPGQMDIAARKERELSRLSRGAFASELPEIFGKEGPAGPAAEGLRQWEETLSPQLGPTQQQQAASLQALLASQDPSKLSGSEMANVERGLGRMGIGVGRTAEMDKYKAALTFGDALAQKQERLGQALAQTAPVAASFKSAISPGIMLGQPAVPNVQLPAQTAGFGNTASTALSAVAGTTQRFNPKKSGGQVLLDTIKGD